MCFSPEADLAAGVLVSAVGIDAIQRARTPEELPLAALPLLFGVHQLIEAFVWWGLEGKVPASLGDTAIWLYLAIAFLLPLWVPLAVRGVEPSPGRRPVITLLVGLGLVASLVLLGTIVWGPVDAAVVGHHIAYAVDIPGGAIGVLYVVATCGALLLSSDRWIPLFRGGQRRGRRGVGLADGRRPDVALVCVGRGHQRGDRPLPPGRGAAPERRRRLKRSRLRHTCRVRDRPTARLARQRSGGQSSRARSLMGYIGVRRTR